MKKWILIGLAAAFLFLTFFSGFFVKKNYLSATVYFLFDYFKTDLYKENLSLKIENENLKAQLQKLHIFKLGNTDLQNDLTGRYLATKVFSTYPFNIKSILTIDKGLKDGVKKEMVVVLSGEVFIGKVIDVSQNFASVRTVFDPDWQIPVKIGENKINGLFNGGNDPKIVLIEKPVKEGDAVFLSSKDFPLHLKIGNISQIREKSGGVFKEAVIKMSYNINELENVYLVR